MVDYECLYLVLDFVNNNFECKTRDLRKYFKNISTRQIQRFLKLLEINNLIIKRINNNKNIYSINDKGLEFLNLWYSLNQLISFKEV